MILVLTLFYVWFNVVDFVALSYSRNGDSNLVVRCSWNSQCFLFPVDSRLTYAALCDEIYRRFSFRRNNVITLQYSLPGCSICYLHNDVDFQMLFSGARIYKLDCVEILVYKENGSSSVSRVGSVNDISSMAVEDEFLGLAFRSELSKPFLSDEWANYITSVGQKFNGGIVEFKDKLKKYAIVIGFNFSFHRNDGIRVHVICDNGGVLEGESCVWFINGSVASSNGAFYINDMHNMHTCSGVLRQQKHRLLDSDVVMSCIESDVVYNMSMRPKEIMSKFKSAYGFDISYKVALRARQKARDKLYGGEAASFNKLNWFRDAVMETNPGSYFEIEVDPSSNRFRRLFLAYGGCISGFRFCLPILYLDGTFGKSVYKGQILAATGRNGNKGKISFQSN